MEKSAMQSVTWHASAAGYQISKQTGRGAVATPVNDESAAWNAWLEHVSSFAFQSRDGCHLTVLKEQRGHGRAYWTAYRSVGGKLKRKYLGASTRVTLARLEQAAAALTASKTATAAAYPLPPKDSSFTVECDQHRTPWQASFVATKFFVPTPSHTLISRPRLVALLMEGFTQKLTLVSAPAGFGKTTLVSAWVRSLPKDHAQVAWVSLDSRDNEPIRFWTAVLTALEQRAPGIGRAALTLLHAQPSPALEYVLTTLINRLSETTTPWVLLLDDYQVISKPAIHAQLLYLVEHQPSHVHLLLLSRSDPPLSLPRLRARGEVLEVGAEELRATVEETAAYLSDVMGIRLPEAVVSELTARTEGWLVGLQLVGLSLQRSANPATMLEEVRGSQRYILDYLVEEVLQQQPPAVQRFLLRTSILEEFCAPLCDAVVGKPQGHQSSQQVLEELERANVFVVPLDEHRQWYRYHVLFAEALRYQLEQQHADELDALHVRASTWYAEQGNTFEAVQHALLAHAWQLAADLIEQVPYWLMWNEGQGQVMTLRQWLQALPADVLLVQSVAYFAAGEMGAASQSALEAERLAQAAGNVPGAIYYLSVAALWLMACGHLHEAWQLLERAVRQATELAGVMSPGMDLTYALQAELLREWNRLDEALTLATQAIEWAERLGTPAALVVPYAVLARVALSRGNPEAARAALERGEDVKRKLDNTQFFSFYITVVQMQLWLAQGELAHAARWADELLQNGGSSAAIGREREKVALIRLLLAQDRPTEVRTRLAPLVERATQQKHWGLVIELRLLQAQAQSLLHEEQEALAHLWQAVRLAETEGYVRLFVDEGPLLETLLGRLRERERRRGPTPYMDTLLAAFPPREQAEQPPVSARKPGWLNPLSPRELEVLQQLSRGASNQEIAKMLVITVETVKRHVGHILGKLRVNNRTQAGVRARTLGLLADKDP